MQGIYRSNKKKCAGVTIPSKMSLSWDFEEFKDPEHAMSRTHRTEGFRPISPQASSGGPRPTPGQPPRPSFMRQKDNLIPQYTMQQMPLGCPIVSTFHMQPFLRP